LQTVWIKLQPLRNNWPPTVQSSMRKQHKPMQMQNIGHYAVQHHS